MFDILLLVSSALFIASGLVFIFYMARGQIHIGAMMLCIFLGLTGICLLFGMTGKFIFMALITATIISILVGLFSYYMAEGTTSFIWWLTKDSSPIKKDPTIACNNCGKENPIGRYLCLKCAAKLPPPEIKAEDIPQSKSREYAK